MINKDKLREKRLQLGLTLEDVGNIVGVSKSTVKKWETGYIENMKRDKIALLAKALEISPLEIMGVDEDSDTSQFNSRDERDIASRLQDMLDKIAQQEALMFDGEALDDETKELLRASLENTLRMGKAMAKQKYTPKKYQK